MNPTRTLTALAIVLGCLASACTGSAATLPVE